MDGKLLHGEPTRLIIGAGMNVYNSIGPGWDEWDYHRAMMKALAECGLKAESHLRGDLVHRGQGVDRFELDIIVEDKVVLELKHIRTDFAPEHYTQLIGYLKFWKKDLGLLMNFGGAHFHLSTCEKLLKCELAFQGLEVRIAVVSPSYGDLELGERESDCLLVDSNMILRTSAMRDNTRSVDLVRLQSCMKQLNLSSGLLINFGRQELLLRGVIL